MQFTRTESSAERALLYTVNHLLYKPCNDLNIYNKSEIESTFIELINPQKSNINIRSIYRHPSMNLDYFDKKFNTNSRRSLKNKNQFIYWVTLMLTY